MKGDLVAWSGWSRRVAALAVGLLSGLVTIAHAAPQRDEGMRLPLPGHVLPVLDRAIPSSNAATILKSATEPLTITVVLRRSDAAGFDAYLQAVYDPRSPAYRQFLTQPELTARFGPRPEDYEAVRQYFVAHGLVVTGAAENRLTLTLRGTRAQVEQALALPIRDYMLGKREFHAAAAEPSLPAAIAPLVQAIAGLNDLAVPRPAHQDLKDICTTLKGEVNDYLPFYAGFGLLAADVVLEELAVIGAYGFVCVPGMVGEYTGTMLTGGNPKSTVLVSGGIFGKASEQGRTRVAKASLGYATGAGQRIGLLEFDTFRMADVADFIALTSPISTHPPSVGNVSSVHVDGGATLGAAQSEVLLDIDTAMAIAPRAEIVVYDGPLSASYQAMLNAMVNGGVSIISNSWASCEDEMSAAEVQSIDAVIATASASGISVFNGTGDSGSTCLDGSANTAAVPADSPHATAVGGSSRLWGSGLVYGSETWWDGSAGTPPTGQGGFRVSKYFPRPSYQNGFTASAMRSLPDVVDNADPRTGMYLCQADDGGCPTGKLYGGTSMSTPAWAAYAALMNQAAGHDLGNFNAVLYPLANTPALNNAAALGSDFAHVGLGSPNPALLKQALLGQATGLPSAAQSWVTPLLPGNLLRHGTFAVPADGTTPGGIRVTLWDANGNLVPGKAIALTAVGPGNAVVTAANAITSASDGSAIFNVTDLVAETVTFTATDVTDGIALAQTVTLTFGVPAAASAGIAAAPSTVAADGTSAATVTVTLKDGLNRPTPGKTVTLSQGNGHSIITGPSPAVTDANGQIQFSVTDNVGETVTYTAVDNSDGDVPVPGTAAVTFTGGNVSCVTAPTPAAGYRLDTFANGFVARNFFFGNINFTGCPGASNPAFSATGDVYAADFATGDLYRFTASGGAVSSANKLSNLGPTFGNLVFGKDGNLYATHFSPSDVVQIDPATGGVVRTLASGYPCPSGLVVDPVSGDLFFDDNCTGGGSDNPSIWRIHDPGGPSPTVSVYATLPATPGGQIAFAPDGTMYAVASAFNSSSMPIVRIGSTNGAQPPAVTTLAGVTSDDGSIAIGETLLGGQAKSLLVHTGGSLQLVDLTTTPSAFTRIADGTINAGVIGPDGCVYVNAHDTIFRLSATAGCTFNPTNPSPALVLSPATGSPAQGSSATFTATFRNLAVPPDTPVSFLVTGANVGWKLARTDANGVATMTYEGGFAGQDKIVARAVVGGTKLTSNAAAVTWSAGQHEAFLALDTSPGGGTPGQAQTLRASLVDITADPNLPVAGASVTFTLGNQSCIGVTDAQGVASCVVAVPAASNLALTASFAGNAQLTADSDAERFLVTAAGGASPPGAPTLGSAVPGSGQVTLSFTAPASDGGSPITGYTAACTPVSGGAPASASGSASPIVVPGLVPGASYACAVAAANAAGTGTASAAALVTLPTGPGPAAATEPIPALDARGLALLAAVLALLGGMGARMRRG
jgi:kumamolisin